MTTDQLRPLHAASTQSTLTKRQRDALAFIGEFQEHHGAGPSYRDLARFLGLKSTSGVHRIISALVERGAIEKIPRRARQFKIIVNTCPHCGGGLAT